MNTSTCITTGLLLLILSTTMFAQITPEERSQIEAAIPKKAFVKPEKPRKLLVTTLNRRKGNPSYGHKSIPYANLALELMAKQTGAFEVVFSNDTLMFRLEKLAEFDAICFNNTVGVLFDDPLLRYSLLQFVSQGKGFVGIHAAAATFVEYPVYDQFPAYGEMIGGYEDGGHPWKPHEWITLHVDEPDHPLATMFTKRDFPISDEVFQFKAPYSRDQLRVLLTINTNKTDMSDNRYILPQRRKDKDLAISWIRTYGSGRVFYSTLGHNPHIFWNAEVLAHYLAGIQYALGDLKADATPSNELSVK